MQVNQFTQGLITDVNPRFQKEGTYRYALNAVLETEDGKLGSISSEQSNEICATLPTGYNPIGHVLMDNSDILVFSTDNTSSEIGIFKPDSKTYTTTVNDPCLNFSTTYPVQALFRIAKGCERVVYFTDGVNPYKVINLSRPDDYYEDGVFQCDRILFSPNLDVPRLDVSSVNDYGGSLEVGAYQFAIQYLDQDKNPTNWFYVTRPVNIFDEDLSSQYDDIDGGVPIIDDPDADGAVPTTTKSINLSISNLDQDYAYYRIAALVSTSTTGTNSAVFILPEQAIYAPEQDFTYTSNIEGGTTTTTLSEIVVDLPSIHVVEAHAQLDNRLFLANVKSKEYSWYDFQSAANSITTQYTTQRVKALDATDLGNPKNPLTPFNTQGFMGDEVYALGIRYLFSDGNWSPVFHIPGREKNAVDIQTVTVVNTPEAGLNQICQESVEHLGLSVGDTLPYWRAFNTSTSSTQELGYYEGTTTYPNTTNCNGDRVYPEGNVRHHRMPARDQVPLTTTDSNGDVYYNILGLAFSNITYPSTDVVGHQFVYVPRNDADKTVLDMGVFSGIIETGEQYEYRRSVSVSTANQQIVNYYSPKSLIRKRQGATHAHFLGRLQEVNRSSEDEEYEAAGSNAEILIDSELVLYGPSLTDTTKYQLQITDSIFVSPRATQAITGNFTKPLANTTYSNSANFIRLNNQLSENGNHVVTLKREARPYNNITSLQYQPLHSYPLTPDDADPLTGIYQIFGGDAWPTRVDVMDIFQVTQDSFFGGNTAFDKDYNLNASAVSNVWVETDINWGLKYNFDDDCRSHYKGSGDRTDYLIQKFATPDEGEWRPRTSVCAEFFGINPDFHKRTPEEPSFPLSTSRDFCSDCLFHYPYRILYSEKSFQEETVDNYRIFFANNYQDLLGNHGSIRSLVVNKDEMYALTDRAIWFIPTRPQQLQTNENIVYVGTGEVLSVPAKRLATSDHSYGGTVDKLSVMQIEYGIVYVDQVGRRVFLLSDKLQELSRMGISNFFENNLEVTLTKQVPNYPHLHPTHSQGVGYISYYDPRYRRIIITKKDYSILDTSKVSWDMDSQSFKLNGTSQTVDVTNPQYFENKSWTVSYSLITNSWVSYHSYIPNYAFNDEDNFFTSTIGVYNIWGHSADTYQTYYGVSYPHIVDFINNDSAGFTKTFSALVYHSEVEEKLPNQNQYRVVPASTFNSAIFYNTEQISGERALTPKTTAFATVSNPTAVFVERVEGVWRLSNMRDFNTSHGSFPIFSSSWADIQAQFPIDKVPSPQIINPNKSAFETERFRDEYIGVRFFFRNNPTSYRISTDLVGVKLKPSFR